MTHSKPTREQIANRFRYHAPTVEQADRMATMRAAIEGCAQECVALTPCSPEQTRALNALHEAMMLFNASIVLNEKPTG